MNKNINIFLSKVKRLGLLKALYFSFLFFLFDPLYKKIFINKIKNINSSSQKYEDYIMDYLLRFKQKGFYIDIGANDPVLLSNTKRFYEKGWEGINIEPNILKYNQIVNARPNDINLNIGCSSTEGVMNFYLIDADQLSTFSKEQANIYILGGNRLLDIVNIKTDLLSNIIKKYAPNTEIDFLSIDTEGLDEEILRTNDWKNYRPKLICVESILSAKDGSKEIKQHSQEIYLNSVNYTRVLDTMNMGENLNSIYVENVYLKVIEELVYKDNKNILPEKFKFLFY